MASNFVIERLARHKVGDSYRKSHSSIFYLGDHNAHVMGTEDAILVEDIAEHRKVSFAVVHSDTSVSTMVRGHCFRLLRVCSWTPRLFQ